MTKLSALIPAACFAFASITGVAAESKSAASPLPDKPGSYKRLTCPKDVKLTYDLRLPAAYGASPDAKFTALFLSSPGGFPGFAGLEGWAEKNAIILVCINDSKNGDFAPIIRSQEAVIDAVKGLRVDPCLRFATGVSGAGGASLGMVSRHPKEFSGVVLQVHSGNYAPPPPAPLAVGFIGGLKDTVHPVSFIYEAAARFRKAGRYVQTEYPDMGHGGAPVPMLTAMLDNMILYAKLTNSGVSPATRNAALSHLEKAAEAAASGDIVAAGKLEPVLSVTEFEGKPFRAKALDGWCVAQARALLALDVNSAFEKFAGDDCRERFSTCSGKGKAAVDELRKKFAGDAGMKVELAAFDEFAKMKTTYDKEVARDAKAAGRWKARFASFAKSHPGTLAAKKAAAL